MALRVHYVVPAPSPRRREVCRAVLAPVAMSRQMLACLLVCRVVWALPQTEVSTVYPAPLGSLVLQHKPQHVLCVLRESMRLRLVRALVLIVVMGNFLITRAVRSVNYVILAHAQIVNLPLIVRKCVRLAKKTLFQHNRERLTVLNARQIPRHSTPIELFASAIRIFIKQVRSRLVPIVPTV